MSEVLSADVDIKREAREAHGSFSTAYLVCCLMSRSDCLLEMMGMSLALSIAQLGHDVPHVQHTQKVQSLPLGK